jgi:hypothetical protein
LLARLASFLLVVMVITPFRRDRPPPALVLPHSGRQQIDVKRAGRSRLVGHAPIVWRIREILRKSHCGPPQDQRSRR